MLIGLAAALAWAAPASAATVRMERAVEHDEGLTGVYGSVSIDAAPGEVNAITGDYVPSVNGTDALVVTDAATPPVAGDRCRQVDSNTVRCQAPGVPTIAIVTAALGDMDDSASWNSKTRLAFLGIDGGAGNDDLSGLSASLAGGAGDDTLTGRGGPETLEGGPGNDVLAGNEGMDYLDGGPGDDVLHGGDGGDVLLGGGVVDDPAPAGHDELYGEDGPDSLTDEDELGKSREIGPDLIDGGAGVDDVSSYNGRSGPVTVDLTKSADQGAPGEGDTVRNVEDVLGGGGDDTLIGNGAANDIDGQGGRDTIRGGGGRDYLHSDVNPAHARPNRVARRYGPDDVSGGAGDDLIETLPSLESEVSCDGGSDRVLLEGYAADDPDRAWRGPLLSRSCERLSMSYASTRKLATAVDPAPLKARGASLLFGFARVRCCRHTMELARGKRELASALVRGRRVRLRVGRGVIRASKHRAVTLSANVTHLVGNRFAWRFQLGRGAF